MYEYFGGRKMGDSKCIKTFSSSCLMGQIWGFGHCIFPFLRKGKELFDAVVKILQENLNAICAV